ncbi:hypothetical protein GJAV_G00168300 [Gymnothorax javanicus]|nr:hypothetical protein GJAV_G00168300 [Gymnothorax javanicus]
MMLHSLRCAYIFAFGITNFLSVEGFYDRWKTESRAQNLTVRLARGVNTPAPIDCSMSAWTAWTSCAPCKDEMHRFKYVEQLTQFRGTECRSGQWETRACPKDEACEAPKCSEGFTCKETGRCVSEKLRCNRDVDCRDISDEDDCAEDDYIDGPCTHLFPIPGSEAATRGYNILTGEFFLPVVDPTYYGGICEYVYNGEWRKLVYDAFCENMFYNDDEKFYRKPYNFHTYQFMGKAESISSNEYYEDAATLLDNRRQDKSFNLGVTLGIGPFELGMSGSTESQLLKNISRNQEQEKGFVRLVSKVQTAQFKMRSSGLMLDEDMYQSLVELPEEYDFGAYSRFLSQYGTHYITSGIMGGILEYIVVIDKKAMRRSEVSGDQAGLCLGASLGLSFSAKLKLSISNCDKSGNLDRDHESSDNFIKDVISNIKGGHVGSTQAVVVRDEKSYSAWGHSLKYNPAITEFEMLPLYELVRFSTAAVPMKGKVAHLKRAYSEYLQQFSSCRCAPCRNNGVPVLTGTSCSCLCKDGYTGVACEETQRKDPSPGSWSCWSSWSNCQSSQKTRQRQCNNPPPQNSGSPCLGRATQTKSC